MATYIQEDKTGITKELLMDATSYSRILEEEIDSKSSKKSFPSPSTPPAKNSFISIMESGVSFMNQFVAQRNLYISSLHEKQVQYSADHYALLVTLEVARSASMDLGTFT